MMMGMEPMIMTEGLLFSTVKEIIVMGFQVMKTTLDCFKSTEIS